ncbi:MAG: asparagine synthase (glutamine-hydrolyzing) [Candidatus Omnitrophica bacterium]|nr:asparagine synthase (glutamine-hydrolyzing) [Candidatus Omnitrophota bacterium]
MCGFAGIIHWDSQPVLRCDLESILARLRHRGPDEAFAEVPAEGVGLAHVRLRVLDLSPLARQPMSNDSRTLWLVYNGEVYNFARLRAELQTLGHQFKSQSDTEVVLKAYEAWGHEAFSRLDGMFAVALWDARKRELTLARDRVGKKPLFYWTDGRCLVFGSEIKALFCHHHVPREVDEEVLGFLSVFGHPPGERTAFRGIRQVPPAASLSFSSDAFCQPRTQTYWRLQLEGGNRADREKVVRELRWLVEDAVRKRMRADVPVGAFLSGGVDSSTVVGLMRRFNPEGRLKTFSVGFKDSPDYNELPFAEAVAKRFGTEHTSYLISAQPFDMIERLVWHHDQPFGDSSAVPLYLLSQRAREEVTVVLTGDGGDELFGGYLRFPAALWAEKLPRGLMGTLSRLLQGVSGLKDRSLLRRTQRFFEAASLPFLERYLKLAGHFGSQIPLWDASRAAVERTAMEWMKCRWEESRAWSPLSRLLYFNFKEYLPNDLMVKSDRCTMAHGLEARSPFLDTRLIEYVGLLPDPFKISGWKTKVILKEAFRDLLPRTIRRRSKTGFGVPLGSWFRGPWREPLLDLLTPSARILRMGVRWGALEQLIQAHLAKRCDAGHALWFLLTFEMWLREQERPVTRANHQPVGASHAV